MFGIRNRRIGMFGIRKVELECLELETEELECLELETEELELWLPPGTGAGYKYPPTASIANRF